MASQILNWNNITLTVITLVDELKESEDHKGPIKCPGRSYKINYSTLKRYENHDGLG